MATVRAGEWLWVPGVRCSAMLGGKMDAWTLGFVSRLLGDYLGRGDHPSVARHSGPVLVKEGSPEGQGLICPVSFQAVLLNALPDAVEYALTSSPSLHSILSFLKWLPEKPPCHQHRRDVLRQTWQSARLVSVTFASAGLPQPPASVPPLPGSPESPGGHLSLSSPPPRRSRLPHVGLGQPPDWSFCPSFSLFSLL